MVYQQSALSVTIHNGTESEAVGWHQMYTCTKGIAIQVYTQVYMDEHRYTQVYTGICTYTSGVYTGMNRYM